MYKGHMHPIELYLIDGREGIALGNRNTGSPENANPPGGVGRLNEVMWWME
jgi:uncharacterized protein YigE (DUF2233 family)